MIDSYMAFKDCRPYCVSKLNCVKSAPVAALLSPFVIAPMLCTKKSSLSKLHDPSYSIHCKHNYKGQNSTVRLFATFLNFIEIGISKSPYRIIKNNQA